MNSNKNAQPIDFSFDDTHIAFRHKSNAELTRAYLLFNSIGKDWLVKTGKTLLDTAIKLHLPFSWLVKLTVYSHFTGGETIHACIPTVNKLAAHGVKSLLDYSVEGKESPEDFEHALTETLNTIDNARHHPDIPFAVFKPTAFTANAVLEKAGAGVTLTDSERAEADRFRQRIRKLCEAAYEADVPISIDAEDVAYQNMIDAVAEENMQRFNRQKAIVFNTHQLYRVDRLATLKADHEKAEQGGYYLGAKLVRGAYMERERKRAAELGIPSPIHADKAATDRDFNLALKFCVDRIEGIEVFNGTHNEYSARYMTELMAARGLLRDDRRCYSSQLFGMSDNISFNLANAGYRVVKYLPYGPVKAVLPYLIRRVEENSAIAGQMSRELSLILQEKERRKTEPARN